jgi:hypothetical protein
MDLYFEDPYRNPFKVADLTSKVGLELVMITLGITPTPAHTFS